MRFKRYALPACALMLALTSTLAIAEEHLHTITEEDIEYLPEVQTVHVGQEITIKNNDPFDHKSRVTQQKADGSLGAIVVNDHIDKPGSAYTFKIRTPGNYEVRCMLHDGMTSTIKVIK